MTSYYAKYNGYDLNVTGYQVTKIEINMPKSNVNKYELVRADGNVITNLNYGERNILITGIIKASNAKDMDTKLDNLKYWLQGYEKNLDIDVADVTRRFTATVESFNYDVIGYSCTYEINFSANSFATDLTSSSLTFGTYTTSNTSYQHTIGGNVNSKLDIDFTVSDVRPWWSSKYIQFSNSVNNEKLRITRQWTIGDRVVVNGLANTCSIYPTSVNVIESFDSITGMASGHTLSLDTTNKINGLGCAKIVMGSASTSSYVNKLNGGVSFDLSSTAGKVYMPIFIPTPTSGTVSVIRLNIGSDATLATNSCYWEVTTQYNGSAIATNAWNYFMFDLSVAPTSTTGTPVRTAIISWSYRLSDGSNFQLNGWLADYLTLQKASVVSEVCDYEGTIISLEPGVNSINVTDELDYKSIVLTGSYTKRYI